MGLNLGNQSVEISKIHPKIFLDVECWKSRMCKVSDRREVRSVSLPEKPDLSVREDDVLALHRGQLQPQVCYFRLYFPLLLAVLYILRLE